MHLTRYTKIHQGHEKVIETHKSLYYPAKSNIYQYLFLVWKGALNYDHEHNK